MTRPKVLGIISKQAVLFLLIGLSAGLTLGVLVDSMRSARGDYQYPLLAKRIQISQPNSVKVNFSDLRRNITEYIGSQGEMSPKISVYFEYLPSGVSININEKNESIAASLMKLPVVMNLYKSAELGQIDLDKKVALKREWLNSEYGTLYQKGEGYEITIREAAHLALKDSDNTALLLIWDQLGENIKPENDSLNYLDIDYGLTEDSRAQLGARSYSSILKCVYLACFNSKSHSEEMLQNLANSSFNNRLTKYLPKDVKVAHKIGTYSTQYQSDCGIVYVKNQNYVLCVMVNGEDPEASAIISDISKLTYEYIANTKE